MHHCFEIIVIVGVVYLCWTHQSITQTQSELGQHSAWINPQWSLLFAWLFGFLVLLCDVYLGLVFRQCFSVHLLLGQTLFNAVESFAIISFSRELHFHHAGLQSVSTHLGIHVQSFLYNTYTHKGRLSKEKNSSYIYVYSWVGEGGTWCWAFMFTLLSNLRFCSFRMLSIFLMGGR